MVTQLYFSGDPLFSLDQIFQSLPEADQERVVCRYDHDLTEPGWAMSFRFDIVLRGSQATPFETDPDHKGGHE